MDNIYAVYYSGELTIYAPDENRALQLAQKELDGRGADIDRIELLRSSECNHDK